MEGVKQVVAQKEEEFPQFQVYFDSQKSCVGQWPRFLPPNLLKIAIAAAKNREIKRPSISLPEASVRNFFFPSSSKDRPPGASGKKVSGPTGKKRLFLFFFSETEEGNFSPLSPLQNGPLPLRLPTGLPKKERKEERSQFTDRTRFPQTKKPFSLDFFFEKYNVVGCAGTSVDFLQYHYHLLSKSPLNFVHFPSFLLRQRSKCTFTVAGLEPSLSLLFKRETVIRATLFQPPPPPPLSPPFLSTKLSFPSLLFSEKFLRLPFATYLPTYYAFDEKRRTLKERGKDVAWNSPKNVCNFPYYFDKSLTTLPQFD